MSNPALDLWNGLHIYKAVVEEGGVTRLHNSGGNPNHGPDGKFTSGSDTKEKESLGDPDLDKWRDKYPELYQDLKEAADMGRSALLKKAGQIMKAYDAGAAPYAMSDGAFLGLKKFFLEKFKSQNTATRSSAEARADLILRTRDSSGKATARRFSRK